MGYISGLGQCVLVLLNVVFVIMALIFLIVGVILKFFPGVLFSFLYEGIKGIDDKFKIPDGTGELDTVPLVDQLGLALIGFGLVFFLVSFMACCGACCKLRPLLGLFVVFAVVMILAISVVGGLFLNPGSSLHARIKTQLGERVTEDYKGPKNSDVFSLLINTLSYNMKCCGMKGPDDFNHTATWTNYKPNKASPAFHIDVTPACCKHSELIKPGKFTCATMVEGKFDSDITNTKGCYDQILDQVDENKKWAIIVIVALIGLLILEVVFSIAMIRSINKGVSPM